MSHGETWPKNPTDPWRIALCDLSHVHRRLTRNCRVVVFVDEENGDVDNIPSDGEGLDGNDETSDESEADSDVSKTPNKCTDGYSSSRSYNMKRM